MHADLRGTSVNTGSDQGVRVGRESAFPASTRAGPSTKLRVASGCTLLSWGKKIYSSIKITVTSINPSLGTL